MVEPTQRPAHAFELNARQRVEFSELEVLVRVMASPKLSAMVDMEVDMDMDGDHSLIHHDLTSISEQAIHAPPSSVLSALSSLSSLLSPLMAMAWETEGDLEETERD